MLSYKLLNDKCKYKNNFSSEELSSLKTLIKTLSYKKLTKVAPEVIIDKEKYIQSVKNIISDSSKLIPLNIPKDDYINYIVNVEKKSRKLLNNLYDNDKISKDEFLKICPVGSRPGILYSNPKVHKPVFDNMPKYRPILSAITLLDKIMQNDRYLF